MRSILRYFTNSFIQVLVLLGCSVEILSANSEMYIEVIGKERSNSHALIFLHGFPADSGKNEDLAEALSKEQKAVAYIPHYPGLGRSGDLFTFSAAFRESERLLRELSEQYERIDLVAHSFGAWVALKLAAENSSLVHQITFLLNPLLELPPPNVRRLIIEEFVRGQAANGKFHDLDELVNDLEYWSVNKPPSLYMEILALQGRLPRMTIQASNDTVVNPVHVRDWAARFGFPFLMLPDQDHWFSKRQKFIVTCVGARKSDKIYACDK